MQVIYLLSTITRTLTFEINRFLLNFNWNKQIAAVEGMKRFSGDPAFKFFYGMALVLEGRVQEGIRELDPLQAYSEVINLYV